MSKKDAVKHRARYTLAFRNRVRLADKGDLQGAGDRPVSAEQMELARLRAELARVKMERGILKSATAYFAKDSLRSTPGSRPTSRYGRPA
jgi:transposase-like protein